MQEWLTNNTASDELSPTHILDKLSETLLENASTMGKNLGGGATKLRKQSRQSQKRLSFGQNVSQTWKRKRLSFVWLMMSAEKT